MAKNNIKQDVWDGLVAEFGLKNVIIGGLIFLGTGAFSTAGYLLYIKNKEMK